jgi:ubiquinone/menaquinone biosynthesis C-methylase UbiE
MILLPDKVPFSAQTAVESEFIKVCCANLYESDWSRLLLGDSLHPGGMILTTRLGELIKLQPQHRLLDVASGRGASALHLIDRFGCEVVGIDYSRESVNVANALAAETGLAGRVRFEAGDAEALPFSDNSFDALICECAFCTFPEKKRAAAEFARVLKPGGQIGLSDLTRSGSFPEQLTSLQAWIACIADALPAEAYIEVLAGAGLELEHHETHDQVLKELVREIRGKLIAADLMSVLRKVELPRIDLSEAKTLARAAETAIGSGKLGYALFVARLNL